MTDQELDVRMRALELEVARITERMAGEREALREARDGINRRLEQMDELRSQIESERSQYLSVARFDAQHESLVDRVNGIEAWKDNLTGRTIGLAVVVA